MGIRIIIFFIIGLFLIASVYACCVLASKADRLSEEIHKESEENKNNDESD